MKRCPTCDKTFDDAMRFCQSDGTPLVADEPLDPYKTMVARPGNGGENAAPPAAAGSGRLGRSDDEVLELPSEQDSRKTTYTTEDEIRREMAAHDASEGQVIEIPPLAGSEPPKFGDQSYNPPPSPFSSNEREDQPTYSGDNSPFSNSTPPIPSPFGEAKPAESEFSKPLSSPFAEPEPFNPSPVNPFDMPPEQQRNQAMAEPQWTPPPVQQSNWQEPSGGPAQFGVPPAVGGENKTLAIVSLVMGILSCLCCFSVITGPIGAILGWMAKGKAEQNPQEYGGRSLAMGGLITGIIGTLIGIGLIIMQIFFGVLNGVLR